MRHGFFFKQIQNLVRQRCVEVVGNFDRIAQESEFSPGRGRRQRNQPGYGNAAIRDRDFFPSGDAAQQAGQLCFASCVFTVFIASR